MMNSIKKRFLILKELGIEIETVSFLKSYPQKRCARSFSFFASVYHIYCHREKNIYYFDKNNILAKGNMITGFLRMKESVFLSSEGIKEKIILNFIYLRNVFFHYFPLHANTLISGRNSVLISGPSGGGKSTLSRLISRQDIIDEYLEDIIYLNRANKTITALAFRIENTRKAHSLIIDNTVNQKEKGNKVAKTPRLHYQTIPKLIIFTKVKKESRTIFKRITSSETFRELMRNSYLRTKSPRSPVYHNQILTFLLASKIRAYKIELGRDTKNNPKLLYKMIRGGLRDVLAHKKRNN